MNRRTFFCATIATAVLVLSASRVGTQAPSAPVNELPNPYLPPVRNWATHVDGRAWGSSAGIDIGPKGEIWAIDRCGVNSCEGSNLATVHQIDPATGRTLRSIGAGLFAFPHGLHVDRDGNIWVTDGQASKDGTKGHQVVKLSPDGKVLMRLGTAGQKGSGPDMFDEPCDVVTGPNGDIFVADGHFGQQATATPATASRIVKFTRDGKFIKAFGKWGAAPGELKTPHAMVIDSRGRLIVADRGNMRLQIYDLDGNLLDSWPQFSRVSGLFIGPNDTLHAIDSESTVTNHPGWKKGVRIGNANDGRLRYFVPGHQTENPDGAAGEGIAVDASGAIYAAENTLRGITRYLRTPLIDTTRVTSHVKVLASDEFEGRAPGSSAETRTVDYLIRSLTAAGVQPGGDVTASGGRAWTQDVPLRISEVVGDINARIQVGASSISLRQGDEIAVHASHLPGNGVSLARLPLVFVGYGVSAPERGWDDYKGLDLRGSICLVLVNDPDFEADLKGRFGGPAMTYYGRWTYKFEEAARRGAAGVLLVHETGPAAYGWQTVRNSFTLPTFDIVRPDPAAVHPPLEAWIQRDIAVRLFREVGLDFEAEKKKAQSESFRPIRLENASLSLSYDVRRSAVVSKNVVGRLPGQDRPTETVIYTAHWDHLGVGQPDARGDRIYNGARDNAIGVAGLIELARAYAAAPRTARSVVFLALTAEEKNLLGSEYYAQHPLYGLETTVAVLNMDGGSVGGPTRDVAIAGDGKVSLQANLAATAAKQGRRFSPDPQPQAGLFFRSDHFPFAKVGVPAVSFRAGLDRVDGGVAAGQAAYDDYIATKYHQPADEWSDSWDLRGFAQDLELLYTVGRELATSGAWPDWLDGSEFKARRDATAAARR